MTQSSESDKWQQVLDHLDKLDRDIIATNTRLEKQAERWDKRFEQSIQDIQPLLAQSGQITPNATELSSPIFRSEATRNFLLEFDHV